MRDEIAYSASREDLYFPCKNAQFFLAGAPRSEAALCVEMARLVYCGDPSTFAFDRKKIRMVLRSVGFTNCEFFENRSTHCLLARRPKELAVLAFRGTDPEDPTDLGDDADIVLTPWERGGKVHRGFANALNETRPGLESALQSIGERVVFAGHSRGAAMATLLASVRKPDFLYTFGSPKVGNSNFVRALNVPNRRYLDCCDIMGRMPPDIFGYVHVGNVHYIDFKRHVTVNPDPEYVRADQAQARKKYLIEYAWRNGNIVLRDLADHAPINYVLPVSADQ